MGTVTLSPCHCFIKILLMKKNEIGYDRLYKTVTKIGIIMIEVQNEPIF